MPFNTGVDNGGNVVTGPALDAHCSDTNSANTVYVLGNPVYGPWIGPDTASAWIGPDSGDGAAYNGGNYTLTYRTSFDLTGYDPATVKLAGQWATDNYGLDVLLNGNSTGITAGGFSDWTPFTIDSGFIAGLNTLDFEWGNEGGPGGLRVEFTSLTGDQASAATPEPSSSLLLGCGVAGLGFFAKRRRAAKVNA